MISFLSLLLFSAMAHSESDCARVRNINMDNVQRIMADARARLLRHPPTDEAIVSRLRNAGGEIESLSIESKVYLEDLKVKNPRKWQELMGRAKESVVAGPSRSSVIAEGQPGVRYLPVESKQPRVLVDARPTSPDLVVPRFRAPNAGETDEAYRLAAAEYYKGKYVVVGDQAGEWKAVKTNVRIFEKDGKTAVSGIEGQSVSVRTADGSSKPVTAREISGRPLERYSAERIKLNEDHAQVDYLASLLRFQENSSKGAAEMHFMADPSLTEKLARMPKDEYARLLAQAQEKTGVKLAVEQWSVRIPSKEDLEIVNYMKSKEAISPMEIRGETSRYQDRKAIADRVRALQEKDPKRLELLKEHALHDIMAEDNISAAEASQKLRYPRQKVGETVVHPGRTTEGVEPVSKPRRAAGDDEATQEILKDKVLTGMGSAEREVFVKKLPQWTVQDTGGNQKTLRYIRTEKSAKTGQDIYIFTDETGNAVERLPASQFKRLGN